MKLSNFHFGGGGAVTGRLGRTGPCAGQAGWARRTSSAATWIGPPPDLRRGQGGGGRRRWRAALRRGVAANGEAREGGGSGRRGGGRPGPVDGDAGVWRTRPRWLGQERE